STLRQDIDLRQIVPVLGAVAASLHLELLESIHRRLNQVSTVIGVRILNSVEHVVVVFEPLSGDVELKITAIPTPAGLGNRISRTILCGARCEGSQLKVIATVQRQVLDAPSFYDGSDLGAFGIECCRLGGNLHGFFDVADLERKVQVCNLGHLQVDVTAKL